MPIVNAIVFAIVALFILVTVHEFGHYWVARRCGVRVERFSIGFGKPFLRFTKWDTEFALAPIPLGGYVKMLGEGQAEPVPEDQEAFSFSHKSVWQRMAIVSAGPIANFLLAILFYWLVFLGGMTGYLPLIGEVEEGSAVNLAGLPAGTQDPSYEILSVDAVAVDTWREAFDQFVRRIGESGNLVLSVRPQGSQSAPQDLAVNIDRWQSDTESPRFLSSIGITPYSPSLEPVFGQIVEGGAAEEAQLQVGDRVISLDGNLIATWQEFATYVSQRPATEINMVLERGGQRLVSRITPEPSVREEETVGLIGVAAAEVDWPPELKREIDFSLGQAFIAGIKQTGSTSVLILDSLKKLITGQISTKNLGGPISIAKYAGSSADAGWQSFFMFMAGLSVMLGVVNLLPIPVLDGGHLLFYIVELVKGSPVNDWVQGVAVRFGMAVLFSVMILALYNDFARL